ncbi:MAG: glycosyltransferase family 4 protein [Candidatus Pacebacteria bacterium]|nr:glycosyltransferase family 4 protein [Candidatus Paceibacterota bacterium]
MNLLIFYEKFRGGETIATAEIIANLQKKCVNVLEKQLSPPTSSSSYSYLYWLASSLSSSFLLLLKNPTTDIVYTTTFTAGLAAVILRPIFHFKIIFHYHGNRIPKKASRKLNIKTRLTQKAKRSICLIMQNMLISRSNLIFLPNANLIAKFQKTKAKVVFLSNGINKKKYKLVVNTFSSKNILCIGRLDSGKNILSLISIFSKIKKKAGLEKIKLIIAYLPLRHAQEFEEKQKIINKISKLNLEKDVEMKENASTNSLYNNASIVISFSKEEVLPLTLLEALLFNKPFYFRSKKLTKLFPKNYLDNYYCKSNNQNVLLEHMAMALNIPKFEKQKLVADAKNQIHLNSWQRISKKIITECNLLLK